jgi:hypothetical protein
VVQVEIESDGENVTGREVIVVGYLYDGAALNENVTKGPRVFLVFRFLPFESGDSRLAEGFLETGVHA